MKRLLLILALMPAIALGQAKIAEVEHGTNSVILNFPLYDATDPSACPSTDLTHDTQGLKITIYDDVTNGENDQFECTGASCATTDTLEAIATLGTYSTPTAGSARFAVLEAGSCWYQLQLPDAVFDTTNANVINIEVTDGQSGIIDGNFWVDLSPISSTTFLASLNALDCSTNVTDDTFGYQICTALDAVLTDTGTTLNTRQTTIATNTSYNIITSESADSGNAGGTTLVDADNLAGLGDDLFNRGSAIYVAFSSGVEGRCVIDYVSASNQVTVYPAFSTQVTTETYTLVADPACRNFIP